MAFALISALCRLRQDNQKLKVILIYTNKQIIKQTVHTRTEWKEKEISKMKKITNAIVLLSMWLDTD